MTSLVRLTSGRPVGNLCRRNGLTSCTRETNSGVLCSTWLSKARLSKARLSKARLSKARLSKAHLGVMQLRCNNGRSVLWNSKEGWEGLDDRRTRCDKHGRWLAKWSMTGFPPDTTTDD